MTFMTHEIPDIYHKNQRNGGKNQRNVGKYAIHGSYMCDFSLSGAVGFCKNGWTVDMFEEKTLANSHKLLLTLKINGWNIQIGTQLKRKTV